MEPVTISSKYQIVIPREVRQQFGITPGNKVIFIPYKNSLRLVFVPSIKDAYGIFKGLDVNNLREEEDDER
jgi:AbrB family looped-hinge helix DNA binding protein